MNERQRGQALPLGLALALVATLGALVLYNTGRVATEKTRLANAADTAAYSGLLWQARAMNFQAYTNRAMVANEVSIAQAVSLRSWTSYGSTTSENIAYVLAAVPPLNVYAKGVETVMTTLDGFVGPVAEAMVRVIGAINTGVAHAQRAMFVSSFAATPDIVAAVARESDPRFDAQTLYGVAGMAANLDDWNRFTSDYGADDVDVMASRVKLVNDSRDDFTRERKWRLFEKFWLYSTPLTRHKIMREGSTRLVMVEDGDEARWEWKAVDTVSLQTRIFRFARSEKKQEVPIGWGSAHANASGSSSLSDRVCSRPHAPAAAQCGNWTPNHTAERAARSLAKDMGGYEGLNAFRSLNDQLPGLEDGDPVIRLRTEVALDTSAVRSSGTFVDGELLRADVVAPGDRLSSISAAELFYRRPDDARGAALSDEGANGYNPYWDVRLAPVSMEQRLVAAGLRPTSRSVAPVSMGSPSLPAAFERPASPADSIDVAGAAVAAGETALEFAEGRLPEYLTTLVDGYAVANGGIDVASLEFPARLAPGFDQFDARDFVGDDLVGIELDDPGKVVKEQLESALETAVNDMLTGTVRQLGENAFDAVLSPEDREAIAAKIDEAMEISKDFDDARKEVAARMEALGGTLLTMLQSRMLSLDFDEDSMLRAFKGYDVEALTTIAAAFQQVSGEVAPDWPVPAQMAIEAAKVFYDDYRERIAGSGTPPAGVSALEGLAGLDGIAGFEGLDALPGIDGGEAGDDALRTDADDGAPKHGIDTERWIESGEGGADTWGGIHDCGEGDIEMIRDETGGGDAIDDCSGEGVR